MGYRSNEECISLPVSVLTGTVGSPTFEIAERAASALRAQGNKFRVVFASTLGVLTYVGWEYAREPTLAYQPCRQFYMASIDVTCKETAPYATRGFDKRQLYAYLSYGYGPYDYFATYETETTLAKKLNMYIEDVSDGWALFEVDRDSWRGCGYKKDDDYPRLSIVQEQARHRRTVNESALKPDNS
ncbi:uncharacterized protein LOC125946146 [Dermacentor silvarum]|uniref:uncharacterized protein LOC125946146 n=1 Tax=Dermacentor silvarum TaxID=543639 RepID=UPI00210077F7|nr:uncharacterized protein LOC125946146 [Dermacentor silvarum]